MSSYLPNSSPHPRSVQRPASPSRLAMAILAILPTTALAQSIEGKPSNGTMSATLDIAVPSYYGIEPKLALSYNSSSANGFVGMGLTLTGPSFVERMSPGRGAPAYRSTDVYMLDGEELVPCTTLGGTHCTRRQSFRRIARDAAGDRWYVWSKTGIKSTYAPLYVSSAGTFRWALTTEQDPNGHVVSYSYCVDPGQNAYLDSISYNGVVIKLWRDGRRDDISFANGAAIGSTRHRLKTIDVTAGGSRARAYQLGYTYSPNTGRSLLQKVTR